MAYMAPKKIYKNDRERKAARNLRLKKRRLEDQDYNRRTNLQNNYNNWVADYFYKVKKCTCCWYERKNYYPDIHHIVSKTDGWKDLINNLVPLCFGCHRDLHKFWKDYLKIEFKFCIDKFHVSISDIKTPWTYRKEELKAERDWDIKTLKEWSVLTGINYKTMLSRLNMWKDVFTGHYQ